MTSSLPRMRSTARAMAANYDFVCISDSTEPKKFDQNHPILVSHTMIEFVAFSNEATKAKWEADAAVQAVLATVNTQNTASGISATGWSTLNVAA